MNKTVTRGQVSRLDLIYPPISNQEAVWLERDPDVQQELRASNFYMIAARPEAKFTDIVIDEEERTALFNVRIGDHLCEPALLRFPKVPGIEGHERYCVEAGEKLFRVSDAEGSDVLNWFTTEKLLWDKSRGMPGIEGLEHIRDLMTYDLLYVGIARESDTFDRLFKRGHKARMNILANEPQRYPGARVTDEIYLFPFRVAPLLVQTFEVGHEFTKQDFARQSDPRRILADAEKAFVSLLKPQYNIGNYSPLCGVVTRV